MSDVWPVIHFLLFLGLFIGGVLSIGYLILHYKDL